MVSATIDNGRRSTLVLRPNRSLSWREAKIVFGGILAASLVIALSFSYLGYWPVLPFAGMELGLLAWALYLCQLQSERVEVISVQGNSVAVEKGHRRPTERWDFERAWVRVSLIEPRIPGHASRLVLRSHGREVSIGDFLLEEERRQAAGQLRRVLAPVLAGLSDPAAGE